jgi:ribosomal protein L29
MKNKELLSREKDDLKKILQEKRAELQTLRLAVASNKEKDIKKISKLKKDIAKILTILHCATLEACQAEGRSRREQTGSCRR